MNIPYERRQEKLFSIYNSKLQKYQDVVAYIELHYDEVSTPFEWIGSLHSERQYYRGETRLETNDGIRWFTPEYPAEDDAKYYYQQGMSKGEIALKIAETKRQMKEYVEGYLNDDWHYAGIVVKVMANATKFTNDRYVGGTKIYEDLVWGVESMAVDEIIKEMLPSAETIEQDLLTKIELEGKAIEALRDIFWSIQMVNLGKSLKEQNLFQ